MKTWLRVATASLVLLSLVEASYYLHAVQDDSFISFRYAAHLAEHGSLAFNGPGYDRAEGYSNFTWVLLLAFLYAIGLSPLACAKALGLLSLVAALVGTLYLVDELLGRASPWRLFAVFALGSSTCFTSWSVQGLETVFVAALVTWSTVSVLRVVTFPNQADVGLAALRAGVLLGVLGISRPETALFGVIGVAAVAVALRGAPTLRRVVRVMTLWFAVPVLLQLVFRIVYYGRVTANTYYAKVLGDDLLERGIAYLFDYAKAKGLLLTIAFLVLVSFAVARALRKSVQSAIPPAIVATFLLAYGGYIAWVGGDYMRGFRFCMHVLPLAVGLGTWGLTSLAEAIRPRTGVVGDSVVAAVATLVTLHSNFVTEREFKFGAQGAVADTASGRGFFSIWSVPPGPHYTVARWLRHRLPRSALVATSEAGIIPFESALPVLDDLGLNDRVVADMMQAGNSPASIATYVLNRAPTAIVMLGRTSPESLVAPFVAHLSVDVALLEDPAFRDRYILSTFVPLEAPRENDRPLFGFGVFTRKGVALAPLNGVLLATPNPVPVAGPVLGVTKITWKGWDGENALLFVSEDRAPEKLFSTGDEGSEIFAWTQVGHSYVFRLYGRAHRLLSTVTVTR